MIVKQVRESELITRSDRGLRICATIPSRCFWLPAVLVRGCNDAVEDLELCVFSSSFGGGNLD